MSDMHISSSQKQQHGAKTLFIIILLSYEFKNVRFFWASGTRHP